MKYFMQILCYKPYTVRYVFGKEDFHNNEE